jgi:hypothetical protein
MAQDEIPKGEGPDKNVTDVSVAAEGILGVTEKAWHQPGIEDTTPEDLGLRGELAERMRNGGYTLAELDKLRAKRAVGPNQPVPTGTGLLC